MFTKHIINPKNKIAKPYCQERLKWINAASKMLEKVISQKAGAVSQEKLPSIPNCIPEDKVFKIIVMNSKVNNIFNFGVDDFIDKLIHKPEPNHANIVLIISIAAKLNEAFFVLQEPTKQNPDRPLLTKPAIDKFVPNEMPIPTEFHWFYIQNTKSFDAESRYQIAIFGLKASPIKRPISHHQYLQTNQHYLVYEYPTKFAITPKFQTTECPTTLQQSVLCIALILDKLQIQQMM